MPWIVEGDRASVNSVEAAGASCLIARMLVLVISGYRPSLFRTVFVFARLISVLRAFAFSLVCLLCGRKTAQRGIF